MALNLGVLSATVTLYNKDYLNKLKELENKSDSTFSKIAQMAAGYLSLRAITSFAEKSIQTFSDLEEETNKFNVVFQNMGKETERVLSELRKDFGLSELSAKKMLAGTGDMLTGFGFDRKTALDLSEAAAKLGSDLASFSNYAGGASGATSALTKAMLGETEGAKMLGIVIRQDSEEYKNYMQQAMTTGLRIEALGKTFYAASEQQAKAIAAMNIAYEQSPNAIGDFIRSQDSLANQTRILQNNLETFYATVGKDMQGSFAGGLSITNELVKAYTELSPATRGLVNNTTLLAGAMLLLGKSGAIVKANLITGQFLRNTAAMYLRMSRAATVAGKSQIFFAGTLRGVRAAVVGLHASLGYLGWAMLILSGVYLAFDYASRKYKSGLESVGNIMDKQVESARETALAHQQQAQSAQNSMSRLEELSKYERLSNVEREESEKLITTLTKLYGQLDIAIDKTTGKLRIGAGAWKEINKAQSKQALYDAESTLVALKSQNQALQDQLNYQVSHWYWNLRQKVDSFWGAGDVQDPNNAEYYFTQYQRDLEQISNLKKPEAQIKGLINLQYQLIAENKKEEAATIDKIISNLKEQLKLQERINKLSKGFNPKPKTIQEQKQVSEQQRRAMISAQETAWNIDFSEADATKQVQMLKEKINEAFKNVSGRFRTVDDFVNADFAKLSEKELADVKTILELQKKIAGIKKQSSQGFQAEQESYAKMLAQREKAEKRKQIETQINTLESRGDVTGARAIAQAQLDKAKRDAEAAKRNFETALRQAQQDKIFTEEERKNLQKLKEQMKETLSDQDHWQGRVDREIMSGKKDATNAKSVGAWSLSGLAAQLGKNTSPAQETARNTKKSNDMLREISRNLKNNQNNGLVYE